MTHPNACAHRESVYDLLGLPVDLVTLEAARDRVIAAVQTQSRLFVSTPNLNFLAHARQDREFFESVVESDLSLVDGMPLVWSARLLGLPVRQRVAGSDLFEAVSDQHRHTVKVYFFGGPDGVAAIASDRINQRAAQLRSEGIIPGVECVGHCSPGFGSLDELSRAEVTSRINDSGADFLVVALGAKKGQAWIRRNLEALRTPVISHLGAVINMVAGTIDRAPVWMQKTGLEWVWRIKEEPQLWKRYFDDGLFFLKVLAVEIPLRWARKFYHVTLLPDSCSPRALVVERTEPIHEISLSGTWKAGSEAEFIAALDSSQRLGADVRVNCTKVRYMNPHLSALVQIQNRTGLHA